MVVQGAQHHLARVDAGLRERAAKQFFQGDQAVLAVQEQHREDFMLAARQVQLQVVLDRLGRAEHLALAQLLGHGAARQLQHRDQLGALGRAQALDAFQVVGARVQQAADAAEPRGRLGQQFCGQLQHPLAGHAGAQQQRQQLGVGERAGAAGQQFLARLRVGGKVFERHERLGQGRVSTMEPSLSGLSWLLFNRVLS